MRSASIDVRLVLASRLKALTKVGMGKSGWPIMCGAACFAFAAVGFAAGLAVASNRSATPPSSVLIEEAQLASVYGLEPNWINLSDEANLFRGVRRRGYSFCFRGKMIDRNCADEQDQATRDAVSALHLAAAQRQMAEKERLGSKERWVAEHPEIVSRVRSYCWNLYEAHGGFDARLLAICFGNLTDFSPLVPLPVR